MTLIINDVSRTFTSEKGETIEALSHISLTVNDEEFICILGPIGLRQDNGAPDYCRT